MAFEWVEFFAGHAEATKNMKEHGYSSARLDVTYMSSLGGKPNSNPMDILSDAGMAMLGLNMVGTKHAKFFVCKNLHLCLCMMFSLGYGILQHLMDYTFCLCKIWLRTAIRIVLSGNWEKGWICHFGLKCSSWTRIIVGTSGRSACSAIGNMNYQSVREANCMGSRMLF